MATPFRKKIGRISLWFGLFFIVLFLFRLSYGYWGARPNTGGDDASGGFFSSLRNMKRNYASEKVKADNTAQADHGSFTASQQFEKTAKVRSKTTQFERDDSLIRKTAGSFDAVIQYEESLGKKGNRELYLSMGVPPTRFDSFYRAVQQIGQLRSTVITKIDKTNEYRQLNAKKTSLEQTLASLNELKNKAGAISDFVSLHDKILEIETQLQELGVDLGNYNTENELCTLQFALYEGTPGVKAGLFQRIRTSLEWTIKYYAASVVALAGILACAFLLLLIVDKLQIFSGIVARIRE